MENFQLAMNAVVPFLCYMMYGYFFRRIGITDDLFYKKLNRFVFLGLFSVMMFHNVYTMDTEMVLKPDFLLFAIGSLLILILLLLLVFPRFIRENRKCGVMIQSVFRSNALLFAVPLAESIFGAQGAVLGSILVAMIVPVYNVAASFILACYSTEGNKPGAAEILRKVLLNPMIDGSLLGLLLLVLRVPLPPALLTPISRFSDMASPLAIFGLGGTLYFANIRKNLPYIALSLVSKLIFFPAVILFVMHYFGFSPVERFVLFSMYAAPVAAVSFPMAQNMGGDGELAAQLVALSTVFSVVTLFFWIVFMKSTGII